MFGTETAINETEDIFFSHQPNDPVAFVPFGLVGLFIRGVNEQIALESLILRCLLHPSEHVRDAVLRLQALSRSSRPLLARIRGPATTGDTQRSDRSAFRQNRRIENQTHQVARICSEQRAAA